MSGPSRGLRRLVGAGLLGCALSVALPARSPAALPAAPDGTLREREFFLVPAGRRPLALAHGSIVPESFVLRVGGAAWLPDRDYRLQARSGLLIPLRDWAAGGSAVAVVEYSFQPGLPQARVALRPLAPPPPPRQDAAAGGEVVPSLWTLADGGDLQVRGSKGVQVASGSRRDLTVAQNLRLNISGQLTRDIHVMATLADDNLPVVPEGNTEKLQDVDQVLVHLTAADWRATLGDFVARRGGTRFGDYRRKLQGFAAEAEPGVVRAHGMFGSPRGRYRTVELRGQEANQGPYFLGGGPSGQNLFIVAGSERVVMDGQVLTRGSDRDYVIDYVRGTVTFTYRRLVTSETFILVEFEEGEGPYARTMVGAGGGAAANVGGVPGGFAVRLTREADDAARLRTGELSAQDEAILRQAGDDPLAAVGPGAVQVAPGDGDYVQRIVDGETRYEFAAEGGDWQVVFFFAGRGEGDYELTRLTETGVRVYTWVGARQGGYRVGRRLPLPEAQTMLTAIAAAGDSLGAGLHAEWHLSSLDRNALSARDDGDNDGQAAQVALRSGDLPVGPGSLQATGSWHWRDARFAPFLLGRSIYDYESWGLGDRSNRPGFATERESEAAAAVAWHADGAQGTLHLSAEAGRLAHGDDLEAGKVGGSGRWRWRGGGGQHRWHEARSRDSRDPLDVLRRDQAHETQWRLGPVVPRVLHSRQGWSDAAATSAAGRGWRLEQYGGGLRAPADAEWRWDLQFTRGLSDSLRADRWQRQRDSRTWQGTLALPRLGGVRAQAEATVREVRRPDAADETTRLGRLEVAGRWARLGSDWSLGYTVDNSRAEVLARQVVYVGEGQGRYDENGNFVGEGRGDYELLLAGTDSLIATTSVRADLNWRQDFGALGKDRLWGAWQSETRLGAEARSRTRDVGRLLRLDPGAIFDEQDAVLGRVDLSEELTLLRHLRAWDLRWRFDYSEIKDRQYAQGRLDRLRREHTGTLTWNPTAIASLRLRLGSEDDRRRTDAVLNPTQLAYTTATLRAELEGSVRLAAGGRAALAVERLAREDAVSGVEQRESALRPAVRWRLRRAWSVQTDLRVADVRSAEPIAGRRPFFFPSPGTNVEATTRVGWDPSRYLGVSLAWFARKPGSRMWQHDVRLESTARF